MNFSSILLLFLGITLVSGIIIGDGDDGGKRKKKPRFDLSSSSSDSDEGGSGGHGHGHGHGGGRPPRPRPPPSSSRQCPSDWMTFERQQGRWCVKVFAGQYNQLAAESQCFALNATLTGLQTNDERMRLAAAGLQISQANGFADAAIWLGARRKATCPRAGICAPLDTFFWTDKDTTGTDGMGFAPGQPDGVWVDNFGAQDCLHQLVFPSGSTHPSWPGFIHGQIDDLHCVGNIHPVRKMYACGKKTT